MAGVRYPSVKDAAAQILRTVEAEQQIKTAEQQLLRDAIAVPETELAHGLTKVAEELRSIDIDNPEVTEADLHGFIQKVNARRTS